MKPLRFGAIFLGLLFGISLVGCGGEEFGEVAGTITFEGKIVESGAIRFVSVDGTGPTAGSEIKDGTFLATNVPLGKNKISITCTYGTGKMKKKYDSPDSPLYEVFEELIPKKYNENSELIFEVVGGKQTKNFDLTK